MTETRLPVEPVDSAGSRAELAGPHLPPQRFSAVSQLAASVESQIRRFEGSRIDRSSGFGCERRFLLAAGDARPRRRRFLFAASRVDRREAKPRACQARFDESSSRFQGGTVRDRFAVHAAQPASEVFCAPREPRASAFYWMPKGLLRPLTGHLRSPVAKSP